MKFRKLTVALVLLASASTLLLLGYVFRYELSGKKLLMGLYEGMPPNVVAGVLKATLKPVKDLGQDARYFDPGAWAEYGSIYGLEITPEIKKRFKYRYALSTLYNHPVGVDVENTTVTLNASAKRAIVDAT